MDLHVYNTLILSDLHLGSETSRAREATQVLKRNQFERLILLGDIFADLNFARLTKDHWKFLGYIRKLSNPKRNIEVVWVEGNHDHGLANIMSHLVGVRVYQHYAWQYDGLQHIAIHGHQFDGFQVNNLRFSRLGTSLYLQLQKLDFKSKPIARLIDRLNTRSSTMPTASSAATPTRPSRSKKTESTTTTQGAGSIPASPISPSTNRGFASMSLTSRHTKSELTIVIPAKNEAKLIPRLLTSLTNQDYGKMSSTKVLVADANSTDGTPEIVLSFCDRLNVSVIRGGMPSVGRNLGAAHAESTYVLFLDADIELAHPSVVRRAVELAQRKQLHCVTTNILCRGGSWVDAAVYGGNNFFQYASQIHHPFATGMFMLFERKKFWELGGFNERVLYAEDYQLTLQVERSRFGIVRGGVYTTNRRFQKMGHLRVGWLFLKTFMNYWNQDYFLRDHKYWQA